jgi:parvulin-like peptidyl-prolyl isomerase
MRSVALLLTAGLVWAAQHEARAESSTSATPSPAEACISLEGALLLAFHAHKQVDAGADRGLDVLRCSERFAFAQTIPTNGLASIEVVFERQGEQWVPLTWGTPAVCGALQDDARAFCEQAQQPAPGADAKHDMSMTLSDAERAATGMSDAEFAHEMDVVIARFQQAPSPTLLLRLKENLVRKFTEEQVVAQRAKVEGVVVTPKELDTAFAEHKKRFGTRNAFASFLQRTKQTEASVKDSIGKALLLDKLLDKLLADVVPTDEQVRRHYDNNLSRYTQPETVTASYILFKVKDDATPTQKEAKLARAHTVLAKARQPGVDFAALVKKYSDADKYHRTPETLQRARFASAFENAAFAANAGDIVGPVETEGGFYIINVHAKTAERQLSFEEAKDSILVELKEQLRVLARRNLVQLLTASPTTPEPQAPSTP